MLTESDRDLLEAYLDDTLLPSLVQRLDIRLAREPKLMAELDRLRLDRATRIAAFAVDAPDGAEAEHFVDQFLTTMHRQERHGQLLRWSRRIAALAACLLVGFGAGWLGRGNPRSTTAVAPSNSVVPLAPSLVRDSRLAAHPPIHVPKTSEPGLYQVALIDETGKIIAVQRFSKSEDARQFADDLSLYQARRQQVTESQALLVSDQF